MFAVKLVGRMVSLGRGQPRQEKGSQKGSEPEMTADERAIYYGIRSTDPCMIVPGLFISGQQTEKQCEQLKKHGITHVLQVGKFLTPTWPNDFTYLSQSIMDMDGADIVSLFSEAFAFIDEGMAAGGCLVHCFAGISRSATVCAGYLMASRGLSVDESIDLVRKARQVVDPNPGFRRQLAKFEELGCDPAQWVGLGEPEEEGQRQRQNALTAQAIRTAATIMVLAI